MPLSVVPSHTLAWSMEERCDPFVLLNGSELMIDHHSAFAGIPSTPAVFPLLLETAAFPVPEITPRIVVLGTD